MLSLNVTVQSSNDTSLTVVTEDGQTLRVPRDTDSMQPTVGDTLILTLTRDTDIVNAILTDTD
jgi:hypothetical protein